MIEWKKLKILIDLWFEDEVFEIPWCFLPWENHPTLSEILEQMEFHALKLVETKWEHKWNLEIRKHLVQYLKNFPWVKKYRKKISYNWKFWKYSTNNSWY